MKKQNLLALFFIIFLFTEAQAQESCCLPADLQERAEIAKESKPTSQDKMKVILDQEIKLFTDYVSQNFEYPELAEYKMLEGKMIVHIVYDNGFDSIKITKSIDPEIDEMVKDIIGEYIKNFNREYACAPRLLFDIPIIFGMR